MGKPIIIISSITHAMRGKEVLEKNGIKSYVTRNKSSVGDGCSYSLSVKGNADEAERILQNNGIRVIGRAEDFT